MHQIRLAAGSWTRASTSGCPHVSRKIKSAAVLLTTIKFAPVNSCPVSLTNQFNTDTGHLKYDSTRAQTTFRLSAKRTSPFKSAGASVQSTTTGSRGVRISGSNARYTMFRGSVKSTGYPLHSPASPSLPSRASPCVITFQLESTAHRSNKPHACLHLASICFSALRT